MSKPSSPGTTECPDGGCGKYPNCPCGESYRETPPEVPRTTDAQEVFKHFRDGFEAALRKVRDDLSRQIENMEAGRGAEEDE